MSRRRVSRFLAGLTLAIALALACRAPAGPPSAKLALPRERAHDPFLRQTDVLSYGIDLELLPATRAIRATCRVRFQALREAQRELRLDLVGLTVDRVRDGQGRTLPFRREGAELVVELARALGRGEEAEVLVDYGGQPERGLWFAGERLDGTGPTLVFSHGQTQDSRGWFPCVDHPTERATSEILVTMPAGWSATANGERIEARDEGERYVERWRMDFPFPSYLVSLVAGEFELEKGQAGDTPLTFLVEPRYREWLEPTFAETDEILAFLEDLTGVPYPFPKYSQAAVDNFPWGGMENLSATTLTPLILTDERGRLDQPPFFLVAHEAAHQWFGNLITCAEWSDLWLNEGFATYCTLLYLEATRGADEFRAQMRETQEAYLAGDVGFARRPTVWNVWKEPDDVFDTHTYQGGAARLHLLRFLVGDEAFRAGVRQYAGENAGRGVTTTDLRSAMERASGQDLGRFFEQWLLQPGFPEFALAWEWDESARQVVLEVAQIQDPTDGTPEVFDLPVVVQVCTEGGVRDHRLRLARRSERFRMPCPSRPLFVRFDAQGWIPKRVREDKEPAEWLSLAQRADDVNARREAVLALGPLAGAWRTRTGADGAALAELLARLGSDPSPWVRADAATALGTAGGRAAEDGLARAALGDAEPRVRTAALYALGAFGPDPGRSGLAEDVFHDAPSYRTMAAAASLLCSAAPERALTFLLAGLERESPHDVLAGLLLRQLAQLSDPRVPAELRRHAADRWLAPTARAVAVQGLATCARERLESSRFLVPFLAEESFHLRGAAIHALADFGDEGAYRALRAYYPRARTSEERRTIETLLARRE